MKKVLQGETDSILMVEITPIDARMTAIPGIAPGPIAAASRGSNALGEAGNAFQKILSEQISSLETLHERADNLTLALAMGEDVDLSEVVIAVEKADLALAFAIQLRNKVLESYQEVMRMPV